MGELGKLGPAKAAAPMGAVAGSDGGTRDWEGGMVSVELHDPPALSPCNGIFVTGWAVLQYFNDSWCKRSNAFRFSYLA